MSKDLTNSAVDRQNILNNPYALAEIETAAGIRGIPFEGKTVVLKEQVAAFFEVTLRTVENYLEQNAEELSRNGYEVLKGNRLKTMKLAIQAMDVPETDFGNMIPGWARGFKSFIDGREPFDDDRSIKAAAPLLACAIRRLFFCPDSASIFEECVR